MLVLVGSAALLGTGCAEASVTKAKPSFTPLPHAMPSPTGKDVHGDVKLSPSPGANAPLVENLKYELRIKTVKMAAAMGSTSAACDQADLRPEPGAVVGCTVTYEGVRIPWKVTIKGQGFSPGLVEYDAEPAMGVITREGALRFYWAEKAHGRQVRCTNIPTVEAVPLDKPTKYRCETSPAVKDVLEATEAGPRFYAARETAGG